MKKKLSLSLEYNWKKLTYKFPEKFSNDYKYPVIYRWVLKRKNGKKKYYFGKTDNLSRRIYGYRKPGPSQSTNKRMKLALEESTESMLYILDFKCIKLDSKIVTKKDLKEKSTRLLLENLFLTDAIKRGYKILNLR